MLRTKSLLVFLVLFGFGINAQASGGGGNIMRGGLGFLFPDNNSFVNPGQFADSRAMAVEALYGRTNQAGTVQSVTPSFVYGNGSMGLGVYGKQSGTTLLGSGVTNSVGAGLGVALMKGRASLGVRYDKTLGVTDNGSATVTLTLNPAQRRGVAIGVGVTRNISTMVNSVTAGLGYSFMSNNSLEVNFTVPNTNSFSTWNMGAYINTMKGPMYLGAGYLMQKVATTQSGVAARVGLAMGHAIDFSVFANTYFVSGNPVNYGATFRASF